MLGTNFTYVFKWWLALLVLGTIFLPMTSLIFRKFSDNGWIFSKVIGFALSGVTVWYLSYAKLLKYTRLSCYFIIGIFLLINIFIYRNKKKEINIDKDKISKFLIFEIIFCAVFMFWAYERSFDPTINYTTEKFMNYGFMNVLFNSEYMPAEDIWLSGYSINYYYFGQYISSFLTKISFLDVPEGFNLAVVTINSFSFMLPFMIGYNLGNHLIKDDKRKYAKVIPAVIALLTGIAISVGGTLYYPIYNFIIDRNGEPYYYWEDSRYIGYRPDTNDKTINEILPYSNLVGDLHAHHIDTMFVFLTLAMLLQLLLDDREKTMKESILSPNIILLGIILGIQKMTNYWDFPIYFVAIGITIIFNNFMRYKFSKQFFQITLLQIVEIFLLEEFTTLPFTLDMYLSATKVFLTHVTSPFYKLMVLWGLPTFCILLYIVDLIIKFAKNKGKGHFFKSLSEYVTKIDKADMFIFIIGCCAIGLMIIPEIIYVKDIYDETLKRANTMYKLCYQAELMFDISASYILVKFLCTKTNKVNKILSAVALVAFLSTFGYGLNGIDYSTNGFNRELVRSLTDSEGYIRDFHRPAYDALQWIKENIDQDEIILEKASGSYTLNSHVSVFTGNPTVLGWHGHEWIWRAKEDYSAPDVEVERWDEIYTIYTSTDASYVRELIDKYNISYIYISDIDTTVDSTQYTVGNKETLMSLGETVYKYEDAYDSRNSIYIVKVR